MTLIEKAVDEWTDEDFRELAKMRLRYGCMLANCGFHLYPMQSGTTHGETGWNDATSDVGTVKKWVEAGKYLVAVAKRGECALLDIDDFPACKALGFDEKWLEGMLKVQSPSGPGHLHIYFPWDMALDVLPGKATAEVRDAEGKLVAEMKLNNASVAAPGSLRFDAEGKKREGAYLPLSEQGPEPCRHAAEVVAWLKTHGKEPRPAYQGGKLPFEFHPDFDMGEFIENEGCTEKQSDWVEGSFLVEVESCPHCGREARESTLAAGVTKLIFSGTGYGFICHACGVDTREDHERLMEEDDPSYEPWPSFIYRHDDD